MAEPPHDKADAQERDRKARLKARLAAALRENLKRRKAQQKTRTAHQTDAPENNSGDGEKPA
jgi:hypothetical protein